MDLEPKIVILLSTYNGEDYLAEQLDSLLKQTYSNFIIIIRDDASTDSTEPVSYTHLTLPTIYSV